MPTATLLATVNSGYIQSDDAVYLTARAGGGTTFVAHSNFAFAACGQYKVTTYSCFEGFLEFNCGAAVPVDATVSAAVLSLNNASDNSDTDFTINARFDNYGANITTAQWVAGASLTTLTLLAHLSTASLGVGYNALIDDAMVSPAQTAVTAGSTLRMIVCGSRTEAATVPVGREDFSFDAVNAATGAKLVLTYTTPAVGVWALKRSTLQSVNRAGTY